MKSSIPVELLTAHVLRFRIKLHIPNLIDSWRYEYVSQIIRKFVTLTNPYLLEKLNKNHIHELIKHLNQLQNFLCSYIQNILINISVLNQCITLYFL